jgi:hypothetical protein
MIDSKTIQDMGNHRFDEIQQAARLDHEAGPLLKPVTILMNQAVTRARRILNRAAAAAPRTTPAHPIDPRSTQEIGL